MKIFGFEFGKGSVADTPPAAPQQPALPASTPSMTVDDLVTMANAGLITPNPQSSSFDGNKFYGGFGATQIYYTDYWELRNKSAQLFKENLYARGIVRRLVTNEINTGLCLEATPDESIIGVPEDSLADWSEDTENRFSIWAKSPLVCDYKQKDTYAKIQQTIKLEAYAEGDVLVILRQDPMTRRPAIQLVRGGKVRTPFGRDKKAIPKSHKIRHGVELDGKGRHYAYWIKQDDGKIKRVRAFGSRGRRIAWLVYGTDKRMDEVRGEPLLSIILQSLKEIDRYRDSVQRKALIASLVAMFIKKTEDKQGTKPISGGAVRKGAVDVTDTNGAARKFNLADAVPGMVFEELQQGEEPVSVKSDGTDLSFGPFEESIIQGVAWALEIPPEILRLTFSNNYSASQAAINEFKMYLNMKRVGMGDELCSNVYIEWLISETLLGFINSPGLLEAWRDPREYEKFGAWVSSDWSGAIKPSTDIKKQAQGYKLLNAEGWITNDRATRELTGTKFSKNIKKIRKENEAKALAMRPILELRAEFGPDEVSNAEQNLDSIAESAAELVLESLTEESTEK